MKGEDSLARDGVTVDRLLPLLHCPKPEMGEEEILYSSSAKGRRPVPPADLDPAGRAAHFPCGGGRPAYGDQLGWQPAANPLSP